MEHKVGSELQLQWPQTPGVLSVHSVNLIQDLLFKNPMMTVTEKLDGSNLCLSSAGWVASRRRIILENPNQAELDNTKFCGVALSSIGDVQIKLKNIAEEVKTHFDDKELEVLLYGEWIQKGTATSQSDRFKYADRGFQIGHLYSFGLGIYFNKMCDGPLLNQIVNVLSVKLGWNVILKQKPVQFFILGINKQLETFLRSKDLKCVPLLGENNFRDVLSSQSFTKHLLQRDFEGFILTSDDVIIKWKTFEENERTSQNNALAMLKNRLTAPNDHDVLANLEKVCFSSKPEEKQNLGPRRRPTKALYKQLFNSASSKFPTLSDVFDNEQSMAAFCPQQSAAAPDKLLILALNYESTIYNEMAKDFVDAGYKLDGDYEKELRSNLRAKIKSEANKILKSKLDFDIQKHFVEGK